MKPSIPNYTKKIYRKIYLVYQIYKNIAVYENFKIYLKISDVKKEISNKNARMINDFMRFVTVRPSII